MTTLVSDLVEKTRVQVRRFSRDKMTNLTGSINNAVTTVGFDPLQSAPSIGDYISVDYEVMYVTAVNSPNCTVVRGMLGTTPAAHTSPVVIEVSARFPRGIILQVLLDEVRSWPRDLYQVAQVQVPFPVGSGGATLPSVTGTNVRGVLKAWRYPADQAARARQVELDLIDGSFSGKYPGGFGVQISANGLPYEYNGQVTLDVTYAADLNLGAWLPTTDVVATVGMSATWLDIPAFGAAWRLLAGSEVERTDMGAQGMTRKAEEVPPGYTMKTAQSMMQLRDRRISEEIERLRDRWGVMY